MTITIAPASAANTDDVQRAFADGGDGKSCQCQWWMKTNAQYGAMDVAARRDALEHEIAAGPTGLIAYVDGQAAGWVRVSPRAGQVRLFRTRAIGPHSRHPDPDDDSVWAISCFVVRKDARRQGVATALLDAAVAYAREHGATIAEGYPLDPTEKKASANALYLGTVAQFERAGFAVVARPAPGRAVVERAL